MALHEGMTAGSLARLRNGARIGVEREGAKELRVTLTETNRQFRQERRRRAVRVGACMGMLVVLAFLSLGVMGAQGNYYLGAGAYRVFTPVEVMNALYYHAFEAVADATKIASTHSDAWLRENVPGYFAIPQRAQVVGITLVCAVLLSVSGMLYQAVFKNPIAGPAILGVSSGTGLGVMVLVLVWGTSAPAMVAQRYGLCYGIGAAILIFVLLAARKVSKQGSAFDVVSLLLIGSIVSQLLGLVISYGTLFVMDDTAYATYFEVSQMLLVDTSPLSWMCLGAAFLVSFVPIYMLRYPLNALAFDQDEMRPLGLDAGRLRSVALLCGAIMILAAQIHTGMVGIVSLVVPILARRWFGCEFSHQLIGNVCIGMLLLLVCRDIADLVPFVGEGLAIGSVVGIAVLPLFLLVSARQRKEWCDRP